jgi:hypothetical protein
VTDKLKPGWLAEELRAELTAAREEAARLRKALIDAAVPLEVLYCVESDNSPLGQYVSLLSPSLQAAIKTAVFGIRAALSPVAESAQPEDWTDCPTCHGDPDSVTGTADDGIACQTCGNRAAQPVAGCRFCATGMKRYVVQAKGYHLMEGFEGDIVDCTAAQPDKCRLCNHAHHNGIRCEDDAPNAQFRCGCHGECPHRKDPLYCRKCAGTAAQSEPTGEEQGS